ncbi:MAG: hypothetical protein O3A82_17380 [Verrucomicrobia bacterium]|nr:hypothetical protein [Verrucomicrobiota bacterium]MDA1048682.1 hypothetical protein [Verrucomicrobiota bacterium]
MKKLILAILTSSLLALGSYADKKKAADSEKPAKAEKAEKGKKKGKSAKVTVTGELKCAHCDFKIGDSCAAVLKTEKALYFLKGKKAKAFAKENPKAKKAEAVGQAKKVGENYELKVTSIALKE